MVQVTPDEAEISRSVRSFLLQETTTPEYLEKQFWAAIPLRTQQVLGHQDLQVLDLLDHPKVSEDCAHFLVYLDVLTKLPPGSIERRPRSGRTVLTMKTPAMGVDVKATAIEACVYGGSSRSAAGDGSRIIEHLRNSSRDPEKVNFEDPRLSQHYRYGLEEDILRNFYLIGIFNNVGDVSRSLVFEVLLLEGSLLTYLGLYVYGEHNRYHPKATEHFHPMG